jgi:two-component system, response regulator PdtaR
MFGLNGRRKRKEAVRRILIVEDDALIAFDNEHFLHESGFVVVATVDNATEAKALIAAGGIDLVVSDIALRGPGTGVDVAKAAHAAEIAVLFVTGHCPTDARDIAEGCLAKPYTQRDLLASIQAIAKRLVDGKAGRAPRALTLFGD